MFSRRIRVQYESDSGPQPCPLKWIDNFAMRNFTNDAVFDDTLPISDGLMEIGARVPLDRLRESMEDWFRRKSYLKPEERVLITQVGRERLTTKD